MTDVMGDAVEKENLQDRCLHLQRRCLPALKQQSLSAPQGTQSHLALARRPLRDTRNIQKPIIDPATGNEMPAQGCPKLAEKSSPLPAALPQQFITTVTGETEQSTGHPTTGQIAKSYSSAPAPSGKEDTEVAEGEGGGEGESTNGYLFSKDSFSKDVLPGNSVGGTATALLSYNSSLDPPAQGWGDPKSSFFPPLHRGQEADRNENSGVSLSLSLGDSSCRATPLRHKKKGGKLGQYLTPIPEVSAFTEGGSEEEDKYEKGGDDSISSISIKYQDFFAYDISRISSQAFPGEGTCARGGAGSLDFSSIEKETLPNCSFDCSVALSCLQEEVTVPDGYASGSLSSQPEGVKKEKMLTEVEEEELGGSCISLGSSAVKNYGSLLMDKTQVIDTSSSSNSRALLDGTYNLPPVHGSGEAQSSLGTEENEVMGGKLIGTGMNLKEESPVQANFSDTYELTYNTGQAGLNVTVELTEPVRCGTEAETKGAESTRNDTYELQPAVEGESAEGSQCDGEKDVGRSNCVGNGGLSESICSHSVDGGDNGGVSMLSLDDTLDIKANLVTSTPLTVTKVMPFPQGPDTLHSVQKRLLEVSDLSICSKEDKANLTTTDVSSATPHTARPTPVTVKVPNKSLPRPAPALRQETSSCSSVVIQRKSLLPSSAIASSRKSLLPFQRASVPQRPSLAAQPKTLTSRRVSGASSFSSNLSSNVSTGKKTRGGPKSQASNTTANSSSSHAVSPPGKKRHTVAESKLKTSGLQKPRESGLAPPSSLRSRLGLRPLGRAASQGETQATATNRPLGSKGSSLQTPTPAQKQLRGSMDDTLPTSKRKRVDSSTSGEAPKGLPVPAGGARGLKKPTTRLNGLQPNAKNSDASSTSGEAPRGLLGPAGGARGLKKPTTRLKEPQAKAKNSDSVSATPAPAPQSAPPPAPATDILSSAVTGTHEGKNPSRQPDRHVGVQSTGTDSTECRNCVQYQQEIEKLQADRDQDRQEIERLRAELQKLTGEV